MKQITIILTLFILCSCGQTETKNIVSTFKNGRPEIVKYFPDKNDTLTYRKEVFYESGKQNYIGHLVNGTKDSVWTWWYENGNKKDQCKYVNGKEIDTIFHWFENGKLKQFDVPYIIFFNLSKNTKMCHKRITINSFIYPQIAFTSF